MDSFFYGVIGNKIMEYFSTNDLNISRLSTEDSEDLPLLNLTKPKIVTAQTMN